MKILLCNQHFYPVGGSETMFFKLLNFLKNEGFEIVTLGMKSNKNIKIDGVKSYFTKSYLQKNQFLKPINRIFNLDAYKITKKIIKEEKPILAHFYNTSLISPSPIIACLQNKIPVIKTFNDYEHLCPDSSKTKYYKFCKKEMNFINCLTCDKSFVKPNLFIVTYYNTIIKHIELNVFRKIHCVAISKTIQKALKQSGIKSRLIYQSISVPKTYPKIKFTKKILYAGRLSKEKGTDYLLKSMVKVVEEYPKAKLLIAGDGKERKNLENLSKKLKLKKNVKFLGWLSKEKLNKLYTNIDFLVAPSIWQEPFGLTAVEAMIYGRPVIAFNVSGLKEIVENNKNGFLVEVLNTEKLSEKILELLKDEKKLKYFSKNARKKAELFSDERFYKEIKKLYDELV